MELSPLLIFTGSWAFRVVIEANAIEKTVTILFMYMYFILYVNNEEYYY